MEIQEYQQAAKRTLPDLGSVSLNLTHMVLGLSSELGELTECVGTELKLQIDKINLGEELGDIYWYLANYYTIKGLIIPANTNINAAAEECLELLLINIGQLVNQVKRQIAYSKEIDSSKEKEYLFNILACLRLFEEAYSLDGYKIRTNNISKLKVRYPEKFTNEKAINRDLDAEKKELEI